MKKLIWFLGALVIGAPVAQAQFFDGLPAATTPLGTTNIVPICQGGTTGRPGTCVPKQTTIGQITLNPVGAFNLKNWTTAGRPSTPAEGALGFNTDLLSMDLWNGSVWQNPSTFLGGSVPNPTSFGSSISVTGPSTLSGGGTVAGTYTGSPTWTGNHTFSGSTALSGGGTLQGAFDATGSTISNGTQSGATYTNPTLTGSITATGSTLTGGTQTGADVSGNNVTATTAGTGGTNTMADWFSDLTKTTGSAGSHALWVFGNGDLRNGFGAYTPHHVSVRDGTAAAPVSTAGTTFNISRTQSITDLAVCGNNQNGQSECPSALDVVVYDDVNNRQMLSGIYSFAHSAANAGVNVQAGNFISQLGVSSTGFSEGVYAVGRRLGTSGHAWGMEVRTANLTNSDCDDMPTNGIGMCMGIAVGSQANTTQSSTAAISVTNAYGSRFKEGFVFSADAIINHSIWDRTNSTTSIQIDGTHTTAIGIANGAGAVAIGGTPLTTHPLTVFRPAAVNTTEAFLSNANDALGSALGFFKNRAAAAVQTGDVIGRLDFWGWDGSVYQLVASITSTASNVISPGIVPSNITLSTTNTSGTRINALRIAADQSINVGSAGTTKVIDSSGNIFGANVSVSGTFTLPASTTGAVTPAFTNAPTGCTNVVWIGPITITSPSNSSVYLAACHP